MREKERSVLEEIELLIKGRYPISYIVSYEEKRGLKELKKIAANTKTKVFKWTLSKGITDSEEKAVGEGTTDPDLALDHVLNSKTNGLFIFQDFHCLISQTREIEAVQKCVF